MENDLNLNPTSLPEVEDQDIFDIDGDDLALAQSLNKARSESQSFFDKDAMFNLAKVCEINVKLWCGKHWDDVDLYNHELPYVNNRVFMATEAVVSFVTSDIAQIEITPTGKDQTSMQIADDVETFVMQDMRDQRLSEKSKIAARFVYLMRRAYYKEYYDPDLGENGTIVIRVPDPRKVVVDHKAKLGENPRFISELCSDTVGKLIARFPKKKTEILAKAGYQRAVAQALAKNMNYWENWFTQYDDKKNEDVENVAWTLGDLTMGKMKNPNYNYGGKNLFDRPIKPYIPINYLTFGTHWIDNTSAIEQVWWLQAGVNRRGFQINQNADEANGHVIISKKAMSASDAQNITGDPKERILVNTEDVNKAFAIVGGQTIPNAFFEQMNQDVNSIDDVLGTPSIFRGGQQSSNTATQDILIKDQSAGRHEPFVRAMDSAHERLYQHHVQMMMVWYDEAHYKNLKDDEGQFIQVAMSSKVLDPKLGISVTAGSAQPVDKARKAQIALKLGQLGFITNPYIMFDMLDLPNASKLAQQELEFRQDPAATVQSLKTDEVDRLAFADILVLSDGKMPEVRNEVPPEYMNYMRKFMMSGDYRELDPKTKKNFVKFVTESLKIMDEQLAMEQSQVGPAGTEPQPLQPAMPGGPIDPSQLPVPGGMGQPGAGAPQPPQGNPAGQALGIVSGAQQTPQQTSPVQQGVPVPAF
jgi:hypothetical protein